jgi:hypothetical protein
MNKVTVMLAPPDIMREAYFNDDAAKLVKQNLFRFQKVEVTDVADTGEAAAEEMFDLTNNPSRQDEREQRYGRIRSVSVGDVIETGPDRFLCVSFGWEKV